MNESRTSWMIVVAVLWTGLTECGFAQITQTSSVADGMSDYQEMIASTDPNNPDALLEIIAIATSSGNRVVEWTARSNKTYRLVRSDDITQTPTNVIAQITANGPASPPWYVMIASISDFVAPTNQGFYAVEVPP